MTVGIFREYKKMGLRKGDMVATQSGQIQGIVVGFKTAEYNSHYHKVTIFCTYSKFEARHIGLCLDLNAQFVERK